MAKTLEVGKAKYQYPSRFGSHASMANVRANQVRDEAAQGAVFDDIILTDEYGDYSTSKANLDNGMADPSRYATSRLEKLFEKSR